MSRHSLRPVQQEQVLVTRSRDAFPRRSGVPLVCPGDDNSAVDLQRRLLRNIKSATVHSVLVCQDRN